MAKKKGKKRCQSARWVNGPCPHKYFTTYADAETGLETNYCIFHTPMDLKEDKIDEFWEAFDGLYAETLAHFEAEKDEEKNKEIRLDCEGFVFPDTGNRFVSKEFPFSVSFHRATFSADASFSYATFLGKAYFRSATFSGKASFFDATFTGKAYFGGATFSDEADFRRATFSGEISLYRSKFDEDVSFQKAYATGELKFPETEFREAADLRDIRMVKESDDGEFEGPGAVLFDNANFHRPNLVQIGGKETDLGRWSFKDTNIEGVKFVNEWWDPRVRRRGKYEEAPLKLKLWPFKLNGREVVYDEIMAEDDKYKGDDGRRVTWEDAGQVYRRLRKNFEGELAYELTSDFHYGQMECRRLNSDRPWWHPDRVVAFLYKTVSGYGERFGLPLLWLLGCFVVFTGAFMFLGYKPAGEKEVVWRFCSPGEIFTCGVWNWVLDLGKAVTFTLRAAVSFRLEDITKDPVIFLAHFWKLFAVIFGTFFILALRRRFKK